MNIDNPDDMVSDMLKTLDSPAFKKLMEELNKGMPCPCELDSNKKQETFAEISRNGLDSLAKDKTISKHLWE
jgi:hypothetical protein